MKVLKMMARKAGYPMLLAGLPCGSELFDGVHAHHGEHYSSTKEE